MWVQWNCCMPCKCSLGQFAPKIFWAKYFHYSNYFQITTECSRNTQTYPDIWCLCLDFLWSFFSAGLKSMTRMMKETLEWWQMGKCGAEDDKSLLTAQLAFYYTLYTYTGALLAQLAFYTAHCTLGIALCTIWWHTALFAQPTFYCTPPHTRQHSLTAAHLILPSFPSPRFFSTQYTVHSTQ